MPCTPVANMYICMYTFVYFGILLNLLHVQHRMLKTPTDIYCSMQYRHTWMLSHYHMPLLQSLHSNPITVDSNCMLSSRKWAFEYLTASTTHVWCIAVAIWCCQHMITVSICKLSTSEPWAPHCVGNSERFQHPSSQHKCAVYDKRAKSWNAAHHTNPVDYITLLHRDGALIHHYWIIDTSLILCWQAFDVSLMHRWSINDPFMINRWCTIKHYSICQPAQHMCAITIIEQRTGMLIITQTLFNAHTVSHCTLFAVLAVPLNVCCILTLSEWVQAQHNSAGSASLSW